MSRSLVFTALAVAVVVVAMAPKSTEAYPTDVTSYHRVKRGDFYGPGGLGAGAGGVNGFGFYGSNFNPVLFQGAAVAGGFAKEAYNANEASLASADGLLSGGSFGVSYYAGAIAGAAAASAAAGGKNKPGSSLAYGR